MRNILPRYRALLGTIDAWFGRIAARFPLQVSCRRGCHACCLGLFDVTPIDAALLRGGLAALPPEARAEIRARATDVLAKVISAEPRLAGRPDLAGLSDPEIDALCDAVGDVPCPVLGPERECLLYAHRPRVCRLNGIPIVDRRGRAVSPDACDLNTIRPAMIPADLGLDVKAIRREEARLIAAAGMGWVGRLVAQVVGVPDSP